MSQSQHTPSGRASEYRPQRERMVKSLREQHRIRDERVLAAMGGVPRHLFVPPALQSNAYGDHALPIAANQTISQPGIVARMSELLEVDANSKVLETAQAPATNACRATGGEPFPSAHRRVGARGAAAHPRPRHL